MRRLILARRYATLNATRLLIQHQALLWQAESERQLEWGSQDVLFNDDSAENATSSSPVTVGSIAASPLHISVEVKKKKKKKKKKNCN